MTTTKNTTLAARRIAARTELADTLRQMAGLLRTHGYEGRSLELAATELLIGNTEIILGQHWATDATAGQAVELKPNEVILEAPRGIFSKVVLSAGGTGGGGSHGSNPPPTHDKPAPPPNPPRPTVTVGAMNIPGRREPGITLQAGADGRLAPAPEITDAMVDRAVDGWGQWWCGYTGPQGVYGQRAAMRHALAQALGGEVVTNIDDVGRIAQLVQKHAGPTTRAAWERLMPRLQAPPAAVPAGYALVPVEPTEAMLNAARDWSLMKYGQGVGNDGAKGCYAAMLAAKREGE